MQVAASDGGAKEGRGMALLMAVCSWAVLMLLLMCEATHESEEVWEKAALKSVMASNRIRSALMEMIHMEKKELKVVKGCYLLLQRSHHPSIRFKFPAFASKQKGTVRGGKLLDFLAKSELHMNGEAHAAYMKHVEVREDEIRKADEEVCMYEKLSLAYEHDGNILQVIHTWESERAAADEEPKAIAFWSLKGQKPCRVSKVLSSVTNLVSILLPRDPYLKWGDAFIEMTVEDEEVWKKAALKSVVALQRISLPLGEKVAMVEGCYVVLQREGYPPIRLRFPHIEAAQHKGTVEGSALDDWLYDLEQHMNGADVYAAYMKEVGVTEAEMKEAADEVYLYENLSMAHGNDESIIQHIDTLEPEPPRPSREFTFWYLKGKTPFLRTTHVRSTKNVHLILLPKYPHLKWGNDFISFTLV